MDNIYSKEQILSRVDHTLLSIGATGEQIKQICDDGIRFKTASVCIPPAYVKFAAEYVDGKLPICTVIGFPNGYNITEIKKAEAQAAIRDGAAEIDMVINNGQVKNGEFDDIKREILCLRECCSAQVLKVIVETCLLNEEEKIRLCRIVTECGADFIKTSTGFAGAGATFEDVALFKAYVGAEIKIKAAGGISSFEDAAKFIELGADRLGTSRLVKLMKNDRNT